MHYSRNLITTLLLASVQISAQEDLKQVPWEMPLISLSAREGTVIERDSSSILPGGPSYFTFLETYHLPVVLNSPDMGSSALTEQSYLNQYGSSVLWQNFYLNGLSLNDPANPGKSIFQIPYRAANRLRIQGAMASPNNPEGYSFEISNFLPEKHTLRGTMSGVYTVNGPAFIGPGVFDREPADLWGAPKERRSFLPSFEADSAITFTGFYEKPAGIFAETIHHRRTFVSIPESEYSGRHTAILSQELPMRNGQGIFLTGLQHSHREFSGVDDFLPLADTNNEKMSSGFFSYSQKTDKVVQGVLVSAGTESLGNNEITHETGSIENEINHKPAQYPYERGKFMAETLFQHNKILSGIQLFGGANLSGGFRMRYAGFTHKGISKGFTYARTYHGTGLDVYTADTTDSYSANILNNMVHTGLAWKNNSYEIDTNAILYHSFIWNEDRTALHTLNPSANLKASLFFNERRSSVYFGFRHDVVQANATEASFLINSGAGYTRNYWNDINNDRIFTTGEKGNYISRNGAPYHDNGISSQPTFEEVCLGLEKFFTRRWAGTAQTTARLYRNLYRVNAGYPVAYETVSRPDTLTGYLYNRTDTNYNNDRYTLANEAKDSLFFALELQLLRKNITSSWYISASGGAYYQTADNIPGNGIYYNDIGRFSEATADPNTGLNTKGRTDYDRGYIFKIHTATEISKNLILANMIRYRDGIPIGETRIADGLSQGPVVYMDKNRANAEEGIGRFAFYMQWDMRLSYRFNYDNTEFFTALDIYNVNDFSLELKEQYLYDGNYRDPVESMMGRTIRITLSALF